MYLCGGGLMAQGENEKEEQNLKPELKLQLHRFKISPLFFDDIIQLHYS